MLRAHGLTLYEPADLGSEMTSPSIADLRHIATWAIEYLNAPISNWAVVARSALAPGPR